MSQQNQKFKRALVSLYIWFGLFDFTRTGNSKGEHPHPDAISAFGLGRTHQLYLDSWFAPDSLPYQTLDVQTFPAPFKPWIYNWFPLIRELTRKASAYCVQLLYSLGPPRQKIILICEPLHRREGIRFLRRLWNQVYLGLPFPR